MKLLKSFLAVSLSAVMLLSITACNSSDDLSSIESFAEAPSQPTKDENGDYQTIKSNVKLNEQGLADNIDDGAILHAWCWSFETIRKNMKDIATAGYSAIQTSPINRCKVGEGGGMQLQDSEESQNNGKWYYHYQPVDYTIGNYQLGTEDEFKRMCEEADKYGIKIIVDAVVNHMTSDKSAISSNVTSLKDPFHNSGDIKDYNDREEVTQGNLLGLVDNNTQSKEVQQYILKYLKQCVEDGASGFRYDDAKHIELDSDDESYASDFWNVITENGAKFQYGEVLQGGSDKINSYSKKINVTASKYGENIRYSILNGDLSTGNIKDYAVNGIDPSKLVTWVESHDNYCNDGSWASLDEDNIKTGWAIIASRSGGTPLFFSRPSGSSTTDQWGDNKIGEAGSDFYKCKEVREINKFRNAMIGLEENLSNPMDNTEVLMVERGDKGAVIVGINSKKLELKDVDTVLDDGTYKDKISGVVYKVSKGKLSGTLEPEGIVVLYK